MNDICLNARKIRGVVKTWAAREVLSSATMPDRRPVFSVFCLPENRMIPSVAPKESWNEREVIHWGWNAMTTSRARKRFHIASDRLPVYRAMMAKTAMHAARMRGGCGPTKQTKETMIPTDMQADRRRPHARVMSKTRVVRMLMFMPDSTTRCMSPTIFSSFTKDGVDLSGIPRRIPHNKDAWGSGKNRPMRSMRDCIRIIN